MIEKIMYKVKENTFRVRDFTKKDNIDESKFIESTNQRGSPQMQTQVCVMYKDEYTSLKTKLDTHESEVQHLKDLISERETQIMKLKKEIKDNDGANIDEVMQLKEEISRLKEDHHKEVSKLHQESSNLEKSHLQELEDLKETHANQMRAIHEKHDKDVEKLTSQYNAKLDEVNDKLLSQVQANEQTSNDLKGEMLTMTKAHGHEIDKLHQEKSNLEIAHSNEMRELEKVHHSEVLQLSEELSQVKQEHLQEINEKEQSHSEQVESIRSYFLKFVSLDNTEDTSSIIEIEKSFKRN